MSEDQSIANRARRGGSDASRLRPVAESLALVAASTLVGLLVAPRWGTSAIDLLYLPAVLAVAIVHGLVPGVTAALAAALAFNFYFTQPVHTFRISRPEDLVTVAVLFLVALVTSQLAARMRAERHAAMRSAARNATVAGFARQLLSCSDRDRIAAIASAELGRLFGCNAVVLGPAPEQELIAAHPGHVTLAPSDRVAAAWAIESGAPERTGRAPLNATEWMFTPVRCGAAILAAVGLARDDGAPPVDADHQDLLESLTDQLALALERTRLEREAREFARVREGDRIRSALLSSIGADLEPRLATIATAVRGLRRGSADGKQLVAAIGSETGKVQRYLSNLLNIGPAGDRAPIEAGGVAIDLFHRRVTRNGAAVHLTPKEYAVLAELGKHPSRVLTHAHLLRVAWGPAHEKQVEYLRVAVRALRQKLEADPARPALIINEPAVGYRLAV